MAARQSHHIIDRSVRFGIIKVSLMGHLAVSHRETTHCRQVSQVRYYNSLSDGAFKQSVKEKQHIIGRSVRSGIITVSQMGHSSSQSKRNNTL